MKKYKSIILAISFIGGLWFSAIMFSSTTYALSDSSATDPTQTANTSTPASTTTPAISSPQTSATVDPTPSTTTTTPTTNPTTSNTTPTTSTTPTSSSVDPSTNTATANNNIQSGAQSGDATVAQSPQGGNATTGSAGDQANLVNSIQSSSSLGNGGLQTFTNNINGNYNGNLTIDPTNYINGSTTSTTPVTDNISNSGTINNTVDLAATSGNATVENNGIAGNAATGDATAEANIINLINSTIADNQSFLGVVNIYGNLNGNILIPSSLVNALLASPSAGPGVTGANITNTNTETVNNSITLLAQSGLASVVSNGVAGNATSGNATTNLNLYNLTNSEISGGNLLLVFVNVSGTWVGLLLNAPSGTTSAAIGGGVQSNNQIPINSDLTNTNSETINNNLYLNSRSGDALVTYNHLAGNATSGNATSTANVVNILGDQIDLSGWLGILIINVYGSWTGSLQIDTPVATPLVTSDQSGVTVDPVLPTTPSLVMYYIHGGYNSNDNDPQPSTSATTTVNTPNKDNKANFNNFATILPKDKDQIKKNTEFSMLIGIFGFIFAGLALAGERIFSFVTKL